MEENRRSARYDASGKAKIAAVPRGKFLIKNISITGCCIASVAGSSSHAGSASVTLAADKIKNGEKYKIIIKPERGSHIHKFDLEVVCRWIRNNEDSSEFGFEISSFPKGKNFQKYVDYLSFRSNLPKS